MAYCAGLRTVWATMCGLAALGLVVSLCTVEYRLEKTEEVEGEEVGEKR